MGEISFTPEFGSLKSRKDQSSVTIYHVPFCYLTNPFVWKYEKWKNGVFRNVDKTVEKHDKYRKITVNSSFVFSFVFT